MLVAMVVKVGTVRAVEAVAMGVVAMAVVGMAMAGVEVGMADG